MPDDEAEARAAAIRKLTELIRCHPMAQISEGLARAIAMEQVVPYPEPPGGLLERMGQDAAVTAVPTPDGFRYALVVSMKLLLDPRRSDQQWMLVMWHENLHILEMEAGIVPASVHMPQRLDRQPTPALVEISMLSELDAYESEFQLAAALGWPAFGGTARTYREHGRAAMACALAEEYAALPFYKGNEATVTRVAEDWGARSSSRR